MFIYAFTAAPRPKFSFRLCWILAQPTHQPLFLLLFKKPKNQNKNTTQLHGCKKPGLMRVKLKQSDLQLTRATACVGVSHAEARTTANGSSGVSKQPSHPPLVSFFSSACRLRPATPSKADYFSLSLKLYFSVPNKQREFSFLFYFLQARRWTQVNLRLPAAAVVTFCPPPPPLSYNNGGHCAVLHS